MKKALLIAYANGGYYSLGKKIGKFGYSVEKKKTKQKRAAKNKMEKAKTVKKDRKK